VVGFRSDDSANRLGGTYRIAGLATVGRERGFAASARGFGVFVELDRGLAHGRPGPVGAEGAEFDDGDLDAERGDLGGHRLRRTLHREFRGVIITGGAVGRSGRTVGPDA
jgi:hypothetical protein